MDITKDKKKAQEDFQEIIFKFALKHGKQREVFHMGDVVLSQGELCSDLFILCEGAVNIFAQNRSGALNKPIASRTAVNIIGEHGFLHENQARIATVVVATKDASFIRITQEDMEVVQSEFPEIKKLIPILKHIEGPRIREVDKVIEGNISIKNEMISALIADIHDFTLTGNSIIEEHLNSFLFDFIESADEIVTKKGGDFEDQGDGFKAIFRGDQIEKRAVLSAIEIRDAFKRIIEVWREADDIFKYMGLGIGICTNYMSVRRLEGSMRKRGRVLSHSINIASALAKYKLSENRNEIFIDSATSEKIQYPGIELHREDLLLQSIRDKYTVFRLFTGPGPGKSQKLRKDPEKRTYSFVETCVDPITDRPDKTDRRKTMFVSYSHRDHTWLKRLQIHLRPFEKQGIMTIWDDSKIRPGCDWKNEILVALKASNVALLLVSAHYLASEFIVDNELAPLLDRAQKGGTSIFPIILKPCAYSESQLSGFQSLNPETKPLSGMSEHQQEMFLVEASMKIKNAVIKHP